MRRWLFGFLIGLSLFGGMSSAATLYWVQTPATVTITTQNGLTVSENAIAFGALAPGMKGPAKTLTITNQSGVVLGDLTIKARGLPAGLDYHYRSSLGPVAPGNVWTVEIYLEAQEGLTPGIYTFRLEFSAE